MLAFCRIRVLKLGCGVISDAGFFEIATEDPGSHAPPSSSGLRKFGKGGKKHEI